MNSTGNKLKIATGSFTAGSYISPATLKEINLIRDNLYTEYFDYTSMIKDLKTLINDDREK
jgi:hypothetical protein